MTDSPTGPALDEARAWTAVLERDRARDGAFVYAVASTGVFCRPSCPSRRPARRRVRFFADPAEAARAGFRACLRCAPEASDELVRRACAAIAGALGPEGGGPPGLAALAAAVGADPGRLRRRFKAALGVTPKAYAGALRRRAFQAGLRRGEGVSAALYGAGYGGPSRVYEAGGGLGMTPATYARGGRGARIRYAFADCPLDRMLAAATERGVCAVFFGADDGALRAELEAEFPLAKLERDESGLGGPVERIVARFASAPAAGDLPLDLRATAFQARVWRALQAIPRGETRSYAEIAAALGKPRAARAVGAACAANPVSLVVPCHRAARADGGLGGYRWGLERKERLLAIERGAEPPTARGAR